ncbi:MAG: LacI family transcriptional regulator, partial [Oscillospiraceae bacterium]|nr:LacI family transcriptional regulator [Oscillospiraceae bacterium]
MKNAKLRICAALLLLSALLLSGCGQAEGRKAQYKIYLITKSTSTEFWRSVFSGANAARAEYNVNLVIR